MPKFAVTLNLPNRPEDEEDIEVSLIGPMQNGETREVELSVLDANYLNAGFGISVEKQKTTIEEAKEEVTNAGSLEELDWLETWENETEKRKSILSAISDRRKQLKTELEELEAAREDQPIGPEEAQAEITQPPEHRETPEAVAVEGGE